MVKSARVRRTQRDRAATPVLPEDLILWEIFYRLPAKEILRCRAVCRSWRRLTLDAEFLLAHHRRQPSLPLVLFNRDAFSKVPATVDAFDLLQSPAVRRRILGFSSYGECHKHYIHASCDGLLLLSRTYRLYYICNPATRQWCALPVTDVSNVVTLYHHRQSGEYHVLCVEQPDGHFSAVYYVLTVGSSLEEKRCIALSVPSPSVKKWIAHARPLDQDNPPVLLHDCLHWYSCSYLDGERKVVVFDTVDESFRCMRSPPVADNEAQAHLCPMDGTLGIHQVDRHTKTVQVWALQDYEMEVWSVKHRFRLPVVEMTKYAPYTTFYLMAVTENGDMLVSGSGSGLLFHCDREGKLVDKFQEACVSPEVLRLSFKESLVRHVFFERKDGKRVKLQSFFRGL
ncbi:hypothetical protein QYE76_049586 [Lolium multiflorum]|uniref:F-box domain-containing protein n=1 Tax=Lolium multiflorum TaxID=4521 RepID=A0AAD8SPY1_LOLMU|nr:hypothetical protein QYE76_049586 [Lolium multiflorum]